LRILWRFKLCNTAEYHETGVPEILPAVGQTLDPGNKLQNFHFKVENTNLYLMLD
jgi:hypothetical protein